MLRECGAPSSRMARLAHGPRDDANDVVTGWPARAGHDDSQARLPRAAMQPAVRREQQRAGRHRERHDQQDHGHHGRHVVGVDAVDDHEAEPALRGEHLADDDPEQREREADAQAGENLRRHRGRQHRRGGLQRREV